MKQAFSRRGLLALIFLFGMELLAFETTAIASGSDWYRYENSHFIAYSDAREKTVIDLLNELENFRAAFLQVSVIAVPADAPKTLVLILRSQKDFSRMKPSANTAAFAHYFDGRTVIVMPARGRFGDSDTSIRHEFAHTMMNYREYAYPLWFNEGFAELASTIEIDPKSQTFKLGEVSKRAEFDGNLVMDWNELLSDDFDLHSIRSARMQSTAYTQSWLLTHYLILGEKGKNSGKLQEYFNLLFAGESSIDAFESSFGMSPDDIWEKALKEYVRNFQIYTVKFRPVDQDLNFQKMPTDPEVYEPMVGYYESFARADGETRLLRDPLNQLGGRWDFLAFDSSCTNPFQIFIDSQTGQMDWSFIGNERGMSSISFKFSLENETSLALMPIDSTGDDMNFASLGNAMNLQMPASDLVCLKTSKQEEDACRLILEKCD